MEVIFEVPNLKVMAKGLGVREICVEVTAVNPVDGRTYTRGAGWLSVTHTLHVGMKCPAYAGEAAAMLMMENKQGVIEALKKYAKDNPTVNNIYHLEIRSKHWGRVDIEFGEHHAYKGHLAFCDAWIDKCRTYGV